MRLQRIQQSSAAKQIVYLAILALLFPLVVAACGTADAAVSGQSNDDSDQILFVAEGNVMLWRDGDVTQLTEAGDAESPSWSPAADRFAYVRNRGDFSDIVIADRDGDPLVQITNSDSGLAPFSEDHVFLAAWAKEPDWSPVGEELVYVSDKGGLNSLSRNMYVWISEFGVGASPYGLEGSYAISSSQEGPVYSPTGTQIAFSVREENSVGDRVQEIWTLDLETGFFESLVTGTDGAMDPDWSPDGEDIVYVQRSGEETAIWVAPVSGESPYRLVGEINGVAEPVWSPDGDQVAFIHLVDVEFEVWVVDIERSASGQLASSDPRKLFSADNMDAPSGLSWFSRD
jgi:TolB protein